MACSPPPPPPPPHKMKPWLLPLDETLEHSTMEEYHYILMQYNITVMLKILTFDTEQLQLLTC